MGVRSWSLSRREVVASLFAASFAPPRWARGAERQRFVADPFALGVASGYPTPDGFSLWTRLAPVPLREDGGMDPAPVMVALEVATDEAFHDVVVTLPQWTVSDLAHSVHIDVTGLQPGRPYFYRFHAGDATSPVGRTRTAPALDAPAGADARLKLAIGSCQHFEQGWYVAHRHLLAEDLDLMVFLGDYIYENSWGDDLVRRYDTPEPTTLAGYRNRYGQHRLDLDLQRLHAAVPWLVTWDDHEVDNDWAGDRGETMDPRFLERRAAAFQAWFEHMPVPRAFLPQSVGGGPVAATIYAEVAFGPLARVYMLDDRQYRSPQACPQPTKGGGSTTLAATSCEALLDPSRTMLGARQEQWLDAAFGRTRQQWNLVAQQTLMAPAEPAAGLPGPDGAPQPRKVWTDGWDGYPEARKRLLGALRKRKVANPIVLGGDCHCTYAADLRLDPLSNDAPVVASELCGTSLTSQGMSRAQSDATASVSPHLRYVNGWQRGYVTVTLTAGAAEAQVRAVDVKQRDSGVETVAAFRIDAGTPGVRPA